MEIDDLKAGVVITGPRWPEPILVNLVEDDGRFINIIASTIYQNKSIRQQIPKEDFEDVDIQSIPTDFSSDAGEVFLALEAKRYGFASLYDPLLAMNTSKIEPLPHQIEAVYKRVLQMPKIRFLLAHDPGAGKTVMAGLIIKELKMRKVVRRVLIVAPGHLKDQWRRELKEKFEENFVVVTNEYMQSHYSENVWMKENQLITSIDFAKQDNRMASLQSSEFDLIIVDEAHKMSAFVYGEKTEKTARYKLGEVLSKCTEHLLFLTATPHKGDPENFRLFMDLLSPGFFGDVKMIEESLKKGDNPLFLRRVKEDMKDFDGNPLFKPRYVKTLDVQLTDPEMNLYNNVSSYVKEQFGKALQTSKRNNIGFAIVILQRRLASSTYALCKSLERRRDKLEAMLKEAESRRIEPKQDTGIFDIDIDEIDDADEKSESERMREEERWEALSVSKNRDELRREIATLGSLIVEARNILSSENEKKLQNLKETLDDLQKKDPGEKILIFTESKDTLHYIEKKVGAQWGYKVNTIHGGMPLEERVEAERVFKRNTQVMVATEAAGEGINLQFCHLMINYDLPWNPNRLEQRMGRIHRYGQQKSVTVFNLVASQTREGSILLKLFKKLDEIRKIMGSDKVFDVISNVIHGTSLSKLLMEAAVQADVDTNAMEKLDSPVDKAYISEIKDSLGDSLASKYMDYSSIKEMRAAALENKLIPEYTKALFKKGFEKAGGKMHERADGFVSIDSIPYDIRKIGNQDEFSKRFGSIGKGYHKITFDKKTAFGNPESEFVTFGHPLFESLLIWIENSFGTKLQSGATFLDHEGSDGYVVFHEGEITDGMGQVAGKRIFAHFIDLESDIVKEIPPTIIWDLKEPDEASPESSVDVDRIRKHARNHVTKSLEEYLTELQADRNHQAEIKQKYGVESMRMLIKRLDVDILELDGRLLKGENVDLVRRNKAYKKQEYEDRKVELEASIKKEQNLTMSIPSFFGIIRIKPLVTQGGADMKRDPEIEAVGMRIAMEYEKSQGRNPEDTSKENLGFDIRSKDNDGNFRYIEVKARAGVGQIALSRNEWYRAKQMEDKYYLYVVWNAGNNPNPKPSIVQNPVKNLDVSEEIVRYFVSSEEIREKSE